MLGPKSNPYAQSHASTTNYKIFLLIKEQEKFTNLKEIVLALVSSNLNYYQVFNSCSKLELFLIILLFEK